VQHHTRTWPPAWRATARPARDGGAIYDGRYGSEPRVWGGELLLGGLTGLRARGHLWPVRRPGGEAAIRQAVGMPAPGCGGALPGEPECRNPRGPRGPARLAPQVAALPAAAVSRPHSPQARGAVRRSGRVCGVRPEVNTRDRRPSELEDACDTAERGAYTLPLVRGVRLRRARRKATVTRDRRRDWQPAHLVATSAAAQQPLADARRSVRTARRRTVGLSGGRVPEPSADSKAPLAGSRGRAAGAHPSGSRPAMAVSYGQAAAAEAAWREGVS